MLGKLDINFECGFQETKRPNKPVILVLCSIKTIEVFALVQSERPEVAAGLGTASSKTLSRRCSDLDKIDRNAGTNVD
jgi:hypothetical protein